MSRSLESVETHAGLRAGRRRAETSTHLTYHRLHLARMQQSQVRLDSVTLSLISLDLRRRLEISHEVSWKNNSQE